MSRAVPAAAALAALCTSLLASCTPSTEARTPEEFVEKYVAAYRAGDPVAILAMTLDRESLDKDGVPKALARGFEDYDVAQERARLQEEITYQRMAYRAWIGAEYRRHTEHDGHFHVDVQMPVGENRILLVRVAGGTLKIHPRPRGID